MTRTIDNTIYTKEINTLGFVIPIVVLGSVFDVLRFGAFGIFELLIVFLFSYMLMRKNIFWMPHHISAYWFVMICIFVFATIINRIFFILPTSGGDIIFNFFSYTFMFLWLIVVENYFRMANENNILSMLKYALVMIVIVIFGLYIASIFTNTVFGYPLYYYYRFAPISTNPAFVGYLMYPIPWLCLYIASKENNWIEKILFVVLAVIAVFPILATHNDIGGFTLLVLTILGGFLFIFRKMRAAMSLVTGAIGAIVLSLIILLGRSDIILDRLNAFFQEADGGSRLMLWTISLKNWLLSPIWGLGFGSFGGGELVGRSMESHSVFLTILAGGGVVGFVVLLLMYYRILKAAWISTPLFLAALSVIIPGISGTPLRKISTWFYLALLLNVAYTEQKRHCSDEELKSVTRRRYKNVSKSAYERESGAGKLLPTDEKG